MHLILIFESHCSRTRVLSAWKIAVHAVPTIRYLPPSPFHSRRSKVWSGTLLGTFYVTRIFCANPEQDALLFPFQMKKVRLSQIEWTKGNQPRKW